ncbi:lactonase family protein [Sphingomonas turrisvirgatae]|uniref:6-phosphogluconolactonase n=1 Tax=Sphingomonas turrisvirgatae TaxID=1888892 RepID=A0A1E3LVK4_9SPHN|nr:lactonase family protein [Sphingomonas turrisvirgatae]ODP37749.1 hypothetical protein BFL28_01905 [Sphingomonas turrisvirgatae]
MASLDLWVGSYAAAGGRGLYRLRCDANGLTLGNVDDVASNASYGVWSPRHRLHYLVDEAALGAVGAYRVDEAGLTRQARLASEGREPCYVAIDPAERRIAVANYASGSIALFALGKDGLPQQGPALFANAGGGPNAERQEGPHMHCVRFSPDGAYLYATDLGTDQLLRFALKDDPAIERPQLVWTAPPGSGPRHLLFHPHAPLALLVCEMASTLTVFEVTAEGLATCSTCSTLPDDFSGESLGGDLAINAAGTRVYVTNRGHDSIAVFALDAGTGALEFIQHVASGGASPRNLLMLEDHGQLLVVNEEAGNVVRFAFKDDGELMPTGDSVDVPGAAFVFPA